MSKTENISRDKLDARVLNCVGNSAGQARRQDICAQLKLSSTESAKMIGRALQRLRRQGRVRCDNAGWWELKPPFTLSPQITLDARSKDKAESSIHWHVMREPAADPPSSTQTNAFTSIQDRIDKVAASVIDFHKSNIQDHAALRKQYFELTRMFETLKGRVGKLEPTWKAADYQPKTEPVQPETEPVLTAKFYDPAKVDGLVEEFEKLACKERLNVLWSLPDLCWKHVWAAEGAVKHFFKLWLSSTVAERAAAAYRFEPIISLSIKGIAAELTRVAREAGQI